jgi:hypothetical protein
MFFISKYSNHVIIAHCFKADDVRRNMQENTRTSVIHPCTSQHKTFSHQIHTLSTKQMNKVHEKGLHTFVKPLDSAS